MPKQRGRGRPRLPKSKAKGRIVPVRFTPEALRQIGTIAELENQTVSKWIRGAVEAAVHSFLARS